MLTKGIKRSKYFENELLETEKKETKKKKIIRGQKKESTHVNTKKHNNT
jgi:hypothetical protein